MGQVIHQQQNTLRSSAGTGGTEGRLALDRTAGSGEDDKIRVWSGWRAESNRRTNWLGGAGQRHYSTRYRILCQQLITRPRSGNPDNVQRRCGRGLNWLGTVVVDYRMVRDIGAAHQKYDGKNRAKCPQPCA
jgi:hypothetical protein